MRQCTSLAARVKMGSSPFLLSAAHGKARVRVAKVLRRGKVHELCELTVRVELLGGTDASFTHGDNANVVATDTCKNHVYVLAKTHSMSSVETFAMDLGSKFLELYHHINAVKVDIEERSWNRVQTGRMPHSHGFVLRGDGQRVCTAYVERDCVRLTSGLTGFVLHQFAY